MELLPVLEELELNKQFKDHPDCQKYLQTMIDYYKKVGFEPPWICYYAKYEGELVGSAGYKGKPKNGQIEIAYGTFDRFQGTGVGTKMCKKLIELALHTDPKIKITARTLPHENASTGILKKNGFELQGTVWDEEDGNVWEWVYSKNGN